MLHFYLFIVLFYFIDTYSMHNNVKLWKSFTHKFLDEQLTAARSGGVSTSSADTDQWPQNTNTITREGE